MIANINETHDPKLRSWVESSNSHGNDYPIQNLPFGVFEENGSKSPARAGIAIGDRILDIVACRNAGLFDGDALKAAELCGSSSLNALITLPGKYGA